MNKYVSLKCTCHLAKDLNRDFYGLKRICALHKWEVVKGNLSAPLEENDSVSYEDNELIERYNNLSDGQKLFALKSLFKKGEKVKGNYFRDYGNRGIDKNPVVIKSKILARKLACIYNYSINPLSV